MRFATNHAADTPQRPLRVKVSCYAAVPVKPTNDVTVTKHRTEIIAPSFFTEPIPTISHEPRFLDLRRSLRNAVQEGRGVFAA